MNKTLFTSIMLVFTLCFACKDEPKQTPEPTMTNRELKKKKSYIKFSPAYLAIQILITSLGVP